MSSLLKRLSEQASQIKAKEAEVNHEQEARRKRFDERIRPTMAALLEYLKEFSEQLRVVKPAVSYRYELPAYGSFQALSQHDYKLQDDTRYTEVEIDLRFRSRADTDSAPRVQFRNVQLIKSITDNLREYGLGGMREDRRGPTGVVIDATLQVSGFVNARLHILGKAADENLCFTLSNIDRLGKVVRNIPVELMSDTVFDRLGEFLLRENDQFVRDTWVRSLVAVSPFPYVRKDPAAQRPARAALVEEPMVFEKPVEPTRTEAQAKLLAPDEDLMRDLAEAARLADLAVMAQMGSLGAYSEPGMIDALPTAGTLAGAAPATSATPVAPTAASQPVVAAPAPAMAPPAMPSAPRIPSPPPPPPPMPAAAAPVPTPRPTAPLPTPVAAPPPPATTPPVASPLPPAPVPAPAASAPSPAPAPTAGPAMPASIAAIAAIAASAGNTPEDEERRAAAEKFLARFKKLRKDA